MLITNLNTDKLKIDNFSPQPGESWCIYGNNRSGLDELIKLLAGDFPDPGQISMDESPSVISFARQQEIFEEEMRHDDSDFLDHLDPGTPAHAFVNDWGSHPELVQAFNLQHCRERGYRQLSSGESRKLILLAALSEHPGCLIIENPYDGLDQASCLELDRTLNGLDGLNRPLLIMITVNNPGDIPQWCSHLAVMRQGRMILQGALAETSRLLKETLDENSDSLLHLHIDETETARTEDELIRLTEGFARYGEVEIFSGLNLSVKTGQHTLITGPNGSGKSTLLQIITGDNQNCYANELTIFGIRRGSGESIWELKKDMGIVSPDLHRNHYIPGNPLQVVLSGFFDSIGIYRQFTGSQQNQAEEWLKMVGLYEKRRHPFRNLSYGEQRLCLIARALIKMPRLLILDEPTQGLDQANRNALLKFLETIAARKLSTILYVSHRTDEFRDFFQQHVAMKRVSP